MRQAICIGVFVSFYFITILSSSLFGQSNQPPVRIGVVSMITPVDTVKYYQEIIDYISARMDVPVEMVYRKT